MRVSAVFVAALLVCACGHDEQLRPNGTCPDEADVPLGELCSRLGEACAAPVGTLPALSPAITVVPDPAKMPAEVVSQLAHNNLDIAWYRGRLYFAFRTGPFHFAHAAVVLYVVSTADLETFRFETKIGLEKDLREPRFLEVGDRLFLYFARLGAVPLTFKPEAVMVTELRDCEWTEPEEISPVGKPGFIPWRGRLIDGTSHLIGYVGGESTGARPSAARSGRWTWTPSA